MSEIESEEAFTPRDPRYPYSDCCPNVPWTDQTFLPCDDGFCCEHEVWHGQCGKADCDIHSVSEGT